MDTVRTPSAQETARQYVQKSLVTFLERTRAREDRRLQSLGWIINVVRSSGVRGHDLETVFARVRDEVEDAELEHVQGECRRRGWC